MIDGGFSRAMQQKLRPPIEEISFVGVKFSRSLILPHGGEWVSQFLFHVAKEVMQARLL